MYFSFTDDIILGCDKELGGGWVVEIVFGVGFEFRLFLFGYIDKFLLLESWVL